MHSAHASGAGRRLGSDPLDTPAALADTVGEAKASITDPRPVGAGEEDTCFLCWSFCGEMFFSECVKWFSPLLERLNQTEVCIGWRVEGPRPPCAQLMRGRQVTVRLQGL